MTTIRSALAAPDLAPELRSALEGLLLSMADDEFVIGFSDSEWTGIAPMLEEDVAMSSLAQDELGHAQALYQLLASLRDDGQDADAIAYDRSPGEYRHARLLDHGRGDWAMTIARRYLYDTADTVRIEAVAASSFGPLRELVDKIRREERYHVMHATAWFERLADREGEPRNRLLAALDSLAPDAATVFTPLAGGDLLVEAGAIEAPMAALEARWRARITPVFVAHGLPMPPTNDFGDGRTRHGEPFRWLWNEFTAVWREDPVAEW
ncbi:MAG TPA: 1,2-phenylacetyl-CoA epoxidase subunit PaaC [Candidatus Limnocylindrales bacterium]|nr:1,2-phenylacetyl-CoA epoxidase subunit PaaC [Candidatus Limnocylindrales bacterium]